MQRQLALAVIFALASLLLLDGCRAKLPAEFSRMQDELLYAPSGDGRPGGDPPDWYDTGSRDYEVSAAYDRVDKLLTITVLSIYENDSSIEITDAPDWIEFPAGTEYLIEGGSGTIGMSIELKSSDENSCRLMIEASDAANLGSDLTHVTIHRPLYFNNAYYDFTSGELSAWLEASSKQSGYIDCSLPPGVSTTEETLSPFSRWQNFWLPLTIDKERFSIGQAYLTASDQFGNSAEISVSIYVWPPQYAPDTLYAYPLSSAATTADNVTIVVASGLPANPFQYMNGVGVTVDSGATYVDTTYNVGAPGGAQCDPDGIWSTMDPMPAGFLLPFDFMIQENDTGDGRVRIDFNVTPLFDAFLPESHVTEGGELFNFCLEFSSAGTYTLGFEEFRDVKRTYFSDTDSREYYWSDISNDHPDLLNSIYVTVQHEAYGSA